MVILKLTNAEKQSVEGRTLVDHQHVFCMVKNVHVSSRDHLS